MKNNWVKITIVGFFLILLILVRFFESCFYDPLQNYFEYDYLHTNLPTLSKEKLLFHIFLRYLVNTLLSLGIIWIVFQKKSFIQFSIRFYGIVLVVLLVIFYLLLQADFTNNYLMAFYIRRFLIQPLFVFLLLPAFYFQLKKE